MLVTFSVAQATTSASGSQKGSRSRAGLVTLAPEMMSASRPGCLEVREVRVVGLDVGARLVAAGQAGHAEGVDVDLGDAVAGADEPHVLLLGHQQRGVRHHVQQAHVELADVLVLGALDGEDVLALGAQALERRKRVVGDERHPDLRCGLREAVCDSHSMVPSLAADGPMPSRKQRT